MEKRPHIRFAADEEKAREASFVDALVMLAETVGESAVSDAELPPRRREAELAKRLRAALRQGGAIRRAA